MPMTRDQAAVLTSLITQINPAWDQAGIWKTLEAHHDHPTPFGDIAQAAITAANNPTNQERRPGNTPERIFFVGPHWPEHVRDRLPAGPACADHPEEDAATCRCCRADVIAGDRPETMVGKRLDPRPPVPASERS